MTPWSFLFPNFPLTFLNDLAPARRRGNYGFQAINVASIPRFKANISPFDM